MRYYLHGDQKEDNVTVWFCARCDAFMPQAHFDERQHDESRVSDYDRYLSDKKSLPTYTKNTRGKYHRPANPPNCLA
jgi:hypothetical protein